MEVNGVIATAAMACQQWKMMGRRQRQDDVSGSIDNGTPTAGVAIVVVDRQVDSFQWQGSVVAVVSMEMRTT